jgi:alkanesulfonate monooxygenase SsuD/methylene tetrahydromethanopterin reductase-like flavin-dependent oxidoreductase (luciferase family)
MKVIVFDLLAYGEKLEHLREGGELPYPLDARHCSPEVCARTFAEHMEAWEELDRLGYDGVGFNEHHTSPYGLMTSPNLMAAAAAQRTKRLKLLIYGNLLPLHQPLRLAEELAMLDCMSGGRIISGFARGIPREYKVNEVPLAESRARFEEAYEIIVKAWTQERFSHEGRFWTYRDVAIWPRPLQRPAPPVWVPVFGSQETIEWAAARNIPITPGGSTRGIREDMIRHYAKCLREAGHAITPDHLSLLDIVYVADSKARAVAENGPCHLYFNRCLFAHGSLSETADQQAAGYVSKGASDFVSPENRRAAARLRADFRNMTMDDVAREAEEMPWGTPAEVTERLIANAEHHGAGTVLVNFNRGAMPHAMFMEQIRRFARDVLPAVQAHRVTRVKLAEEAAA